ncbi:MAG: class I SAM-dependent methyltransferase [Acidobacteria bacterium]|nr:class I SAM-dependent methyltransferase [Acidobacteriota bacterium]
MTDQDQYSRVDYRRLIAWPERLKREGPFFESVFASASPRRLLDLGCGTGEHARLLASGGFEVVGVDSSPTMLEKARSSGPLGSAQFVEGDICNLDAVVAGAFGGAICLGNVLPHVSDGEALNAFFTGLAARLSPGAPFVLQILNYDRIIEKGERYLPLNFRDGDDGEIVFLRLMSPRPDGTVLFFPTTLELRPEDDEQPVRVNHARRVVLRGWRSAEIESACRAGGFSEVALLGSYEREAFDPAISRDLVVVARR